MSETKSYSKINSHETEENNESHSHETVEAVKESRSDERIAHHLELVRFIIVFIICSSYFVYQLMLYTDPQANRQEKTSVDKITSLGIPYIQISAAITSPSIVICPSLINSDARFEELQEITETCNYLMYPADWNPYLNEWTIYYTSSRMGMVQEIFIIPPYKKQMSVNETLYIGLESFDDRHSHITDDDDYLSMLSSMEHAQIESIMWTQTAVNDPLDIDLDTAAKDSFSQLMYSRTGTRTDGEINIFRQNAFGQDSRRYGLDYIVTPPYAANVEFNNETKLWTRKTIIGLTMNSLQTETVLTINKRWTFLDVLSSTGGMIGLVWPGSLMILKYLLSGLQIKKCKVPGIAPHFGLKNEEKRKILLYLKEINVVSESDQNVVP